MAKKPTTTEQPQAADKPADKSVRATVRVLAAALNEEGITYFQGAEFTTTPERARALGTLVEILPG